MLELAHPCRTDDLLGLRRLLGLQAAPGADPGQHDQHPDEDQQPARHPAGRALRRDLRARAGDHRHGRGQLARLLLQRGRRGVAGAGPAARQRRHVLVGEPGERGEHEAGATTGVEAVEARGRGRGLVVPPRRAVACPLLEQQPPHLDVGAGTLAQLAPVVPRAGQRAVGQDRGVAGRAAQHRDRLHQGGASRRDVRREVLLVGGAHGDRVGQGCSDIGP